MARTKGMKGADNTALKAAAAWAARLKGGAVDERMRADFRAWLDEAPEHQRAFDSVERAWDLTGALPEEACRELRAEAYGQNPRFSTKAVRRALSAAAALLAVVGIGLFWAFLPRGDGTPAPQVFITAVGERSTVTLADGSLAILNTNSRLEVEYNEKNRNVRLTSGQALFEVEKDKNRPFVVTAGERRITALGTRFDVRLDRKQVQVTLIEGRIRVNLSEEARRPGTDAQNAELTPGQQLVASGSRRGRVRPARLDRVTSWRDGRLIFEDEPLERAIAEVNRYSTTQLVLNDPALGELRISGVFRTGRPRNFVQALTAYFPIHAMPSPSRDAIILTKRH